MNTSTKTKKSAKSATRKSKTSKSNRKKESEKPPVVSLPPEGQRLAARVDDLQLTASDLVSSKDKQPGHKLARNEDSDPTRHTTQTALAAESQLDNAASLRASHINGQPNPRIPGKTPADATAERNKADAGKEPRRATIETPRAELARLVSEAKNRGPGSTMALRTFLEAHPELYQHHGDIARALRYNYSKATVGDDQLKIESVFLKNEQLIESYQNGRILDPSEQILVNTIVTCSMRFDMVELMALEQFDCMASKTVSVMLAKQESAQNALHKAIDQLEKYRSLQTIR